MSGGFTYICKWSVPKPGHEFQYWLAWKHRYRASLILAQASRPHNLLLRPRFYKRAFQLWGNAVDRIKVHGRDEIIHA